MHVFLPNLLKYKYFFMLLLFSLLFQNGFSQNESLLSAVAAPIALNASGDPMNNGIDPNGMKFGNWYYVNAYGQRFYGEEFVKGKKVATHVYMNGASYNAIELVSSNLSSFQAGLHKIMVENSLEPNVNRSFLFVCNPEGTVLYAVIPFGQWKLEELQKLASLFPVGPIKNTSYVALYWK